MSKLRATLLYLALILEIFTSVQANSPIPANEISSTNYLSRADRKRFAMFSRPLWHFAAGDDRYPPCYPTYVFRPDGAKRPAQKRSLWPVIAHCKQPDRGTSGFGGGPMPTYFTVKRCGDEIRVSYSLFWEFDGFSNPSAGHDYDWEYAIVTWKQVGGNWYRKDLFLSQHKGGERKNWNDGIVKTFYADDTNDGGNDKDHPKIYVGFAKHALRFDIKNHSNGGAVDVIGIETDLEFRSDTWYWYPSSGDLLDAGPGNWDGEKALRVDWGEASSNPINVWENICDK